MKPTLEERILATGETLERVRQWESIIETIAAKTGEPKDDVASIVLRPLASGKVNLSDCYELLEIGVQSSNYFMTHVASGNAGIDALLHELTQLGYNREKAMKPPAKEDEDEQPPLLPVIENKLEIYPNAVLIDGKQVRVRKDGVNINNYANREELMTVTLELMPSAVAIHPQLYKGTENHG